VLFDIVTRLFNTIPMMFSIVQLLFDTMPVLLDIAPLLFVIGVASLQKIV